MKTRLMKATAAIAILSLAFCYTSASQAVTIETVLIGNAGNAGDVQSQGTFGAVSYEYRIGLTEVTNSQYAAFLNAVASSDPYGLYDSGMGFSSIGGITQSGSSGNYTYTVKADAAGQGSGGTDYTYGDKPVVAVTWYDSIRFANWLHNGQGSGDTENGAYTLLGGTPTPSNGDSIARNLGAKVFLPSEDEWYKAAYHKNDGVTGNYWDYPTSADSAPNNNLPSADTGNSANFYNGNYSTGDGSYPLTSAGAYALSDSPYGTFDQGGNVSEWNEALYPASFSGVRGVRGSTFDGHSGSNFSEFLNASEQNSGSPFSSNFVSGFRIASTDIIAGPSIPEPTSLLLATLAGLFGLGTTAGRRRE